MRWDAMRWNPFWWLWQRKRCRRWQWQWATGDWLHQHKSMNAVTQRWRYGQKLFLIENTVDIHWNVRLLWPSLVAPLSASHPITTTIQKMVCDDRCQSKRSRLLCDAHNYIQQLIFADYLPYVWMLDASTTSNACRAQHNYPVFQCSSVFTWNENVIKRQ